MRSNTNSIIMKTKKSKLIIILIVAEICILFYLLYCDSMNGTNDDIFGNTFDFAIVTVVGTLILIPELEIWHIILYFVLDNNCKKVYKTIINFI